MLVLNYIISKMKYKYVINSIILSQREKGISYLNIFRNKEVKEKNMKEYNEKE